MVDIPTQEPEIIIAGDTVKWKKSLSDYKASDGWALKYYLQGATPITLTASADGDDHLISISAATSSSYTPGTYWWNSYVEKSGERYSIAQGTFLVKENFATLTGAYDGRSHVKKVLDALEATILGKASKDQQSYSIAGRSISRMTVEEIIKWRDVYKRDYQNEMRSEKIARGLDTKSLVRVRFNS